MYGEKRKACSLSAILRPRCCAVCSICRAEWAYTLPPHRAESRGTSARGLQTKASKTITPRGARTRATSRNSNSIFAKWKTNRSAIVASKLPSAKGSENASACARFISPMRLLVRGACAACSSIARDVSIPTTVPCGAIARINRPVPHPRSSARWKGVTSPSAISISRALTQAPLAPPKRCSSYAFAISGWE